MISLRSGWLIDPLRDITPAAAPAAVVSTTTPPAASLTVGGRSTAPIHGARPRKTAYSTACSSSRTLPGQRYRERASRAAGENPSTWRPPRAMAAVRKCSASIGMSWMRSRSVGISIVITFTRQKRSARKVPAATSAARSSLVARITRASTACVCEPPTDSNRRSCRTRNSFTCMAGDAVAISSRKMVPPSACRNFPSRSAVAPVKAPATWPKSSLSSSVSLRQPQATSTNRPPRRRLARWISRASSDLPVPLSPVISSVAGASARRATRSSTCCIDGDMPSSFGTTGRATATRCEATATAASSAANRSASWAGVWTMASGSTPGVTAEAEVSGTVITIPVPADVSRRLAAIRAAPFRGKRPSMMQAAWGSRDRSRRASSAPPTALACQPRLQSHWAVWDATRRSSSTTSTRPGLEGRSSGAAERIMVASWERTW